jgi:hypothetical protein
MNNKHEYMHGPVDGVAAEGATNIGSKIKHICYKWQ